MTADLSPDRRDSAGRGRAPVQDWMWTAALLSAVAMTAGLLVFGAATLG